MAEGGAANRPRPLDSGTAHAQTNQPPPTPLSPRPAEKGQTNHVRHCLWRLERQCFLVKNSRYVYRSKLAVSPGNLLNKTWIGSEQTCPSMYMNKKKPTTYVPASVLVETHAQMVCFAGVFCREYAKVQRCPLWWVAVTHSLNLAIYAGRPRECASHVPPYCLGTR